MLLTRPLVTAGISFLTTALVVSFFSVKVSLAIIISCVILLLIALIVFREKKRIAVSVILASVIIAASSYVFFVNYKEYHLNEFDGQTGVITGVVTDITPARNSKTAYTLKVTGSTINDMPTGFKGILYAKTDTLINFNDTIKIEVKFRKITSSTIFNCEQYYRAKGIAMTFSSYADATVVETGNHNLLYYAKRLNVGCCEIIDRYVQRPYAGLLKAMVLGNDNDIDDIAYNSIIKAGVSHVFVVSGLHISMLAMIIFFILKTIGMSLRLRSVITAFSAWGFVAITGFGLPAVRAGIMLTVLMAANLFKRKSDTLTSLFLSGIIIVLINPISIVDASFMLTFTATLGIILFARPIDNYICITFNIKSRIAKYFIDIIGVTLAANLTMFPVIMYIFRGISVVAPLTNIIVVPLMPVILVVSIFLLCFNSIPAVAGLFGSVVKAIIAIILRACDAISSFSFSYIGLNYKFVYFWLIVSIILIVMTCLLVRQKQLKLNVLFISFAGLMLCLGFNSVYNHDNVEIATLNSYEAQSVIITYNSRATIVAFGEDGRIDVDVENYLRSKNIHKIDNYVFTSSKRKNISDTEFLTTVIDTYNVYIHDNDNLISYANDSFKPLNGIYSLKNNGGYDILNLNGTAMSVEKFDSGILVSLIIGQTKVAITNSAEIACNANCEILYFCGEYDKKLTQNRAKYVILLDRFELERLNQKIDSINAYEKQINITVRQNGRYKIGV